MLTLLALALTTASAEDALLLENALLWDGTGAAARPTDILIVGDRIAAVGVGIEAPEGAVVRDLEGRTTLPGLIDSHVHVTSVPGSFYREESVPEVYDLVRQQLRAYVACGVTTVLDAAIPHHDVEAIRGWNAAGHAGPELLVLGLPLSPPEGYIRTIIEAAPGFATPAEIDAHLDELVALGAVGTKMPMEEGFVFPIWPLHTASMRAHIAAAAAARGLPIYVHAMSNREYRLALDMDVYAFVHPVQKPTRRTVRRVAAANTWVVSAISIADMFSMASQPERMDDPLVQLTVAPSVLDTAQDPGAKDAYLAEILQRMIPKLAGSFGGMAGTQLEAPAAVQRRTDVLTRSIRRLDAAGVRVVMGSDAGNWPQLPYSFHGTVSLRELQLLGGVLGPEGALLAATALPAEMLGRSDEIGRVLPGMRADLLVVDGDPLVDLSDISRVAWTVRAGDMRAPAEWMADPGLSAPLPEFPQWMREAMQAAGR